SHRHRSPPWQVWDRFAGGEVRSQAGLRAATRPDRAWSRFAVALPRAAWSRPVRQHRQPAGLRGGARRRRGVSGGERGAAREGAPGGEARGGGGGGSGGGGGGAAAPPPLSLGFPIASACARSAYSTTARTGVAGRSRRRTSSSARRV